jgi:coiled-coil-helix-coiled-coil-helix domain-containing protein 2
MRTSKLVATSFGLAVLSALALACKSEEPAQTGGYPQQTQPAAVGQPPTQPGYGQPVATAAPAPAPAAPATPAAPAPAAAPAAAAALSPPGPLAPPCTADGQCGTAHCNVAAGKCVFPCVTDNDCIAPNRCQVGVCLPAMPGQ